MTQLPRASSITANCLSFVQHGLIRPLVVKWRRAWTDYFVTQSSEISQRHARAITGENRVPLRNATVPDRRLPWPGDTRQIS